MQEIVDIEEMFLPGFECEFHGPYDNEFAGTGVSVVILVANKKQ